MHRPWPHHSGKPPKKSISFLLDQFSSLDIRRWIAIRDAYLKFHWDYYSSLVYQRSRIADELKKALLEASQKSYRFSKWQRVVKFKHSLEPLSVKGSLIDPGGRFNIGEIDPSQFLPFPSLYVAANRNTALQELLSQNITSGKENEALSFALANPTSITSVSLSGQLDSIINLKEQGNLQSFVDLLKDFSVPEHLKKTSKLMRLPEPDLIKTVPKLLDALLIPNWREWPMQFDVPVASQIFAQIAVDAGIEGILYPSKFLGGGDCLAIFPQNFDETNSSFVQLDDPAPSGTKILKWDFNSWQEFQIKV